jgi:hypothetical protein
MRAMKLTQYLPAVTVAITMAATNAFGDSLGLIPTLGTDTVNQSFAITPDGAYVAGSSGSGTSARGFFYPVGGTSAYNVLSSDNAQATTANGIGYRTSGGQTEILVSGMTSSGPAEFMTPLGGTTFGVKRRNAAMPATQTMGTMNQLGSQLGTDIYYVSSSRNVAGQPIYLSQGSGPWVATMTYSTKSLSTGDRGIMNGVSATGRAVGRRGAGGSSYMPYVMDYAAGTPTAYYLNSLHDGSGPGVDLGEATAVSQNGQAVFGRSFLTGTTGDQYSFKTTLAGSNPGTQGPVVQLPELAGTAGSVTRTFVYGASPDGVWGVGMDYLGTEKAAIWWTGDNANPANWVVTDLTQYAIDHGIIDGWTRLTRAYSVGLAANGDPIITGVGVYGGVTRAFVMQIPEPSAVVLAGLGLCGLLVFRRRK